MQTYRDIAQLSVFICGVDEDSQAVEEPLELVPVKGKMGADKVFFVALIADTNCLEKNWLGL
jgi:hypothetical protein